MSDTSSQVKRSNRIPHGYALFLTVQGVSRLVYGSTEVSREELDGGHLLVRSEDGNHVQIPEGYILIRQLPHGILTYPSSTWVSGQDACRGVLSTLEEASEITRRLQEIHTLVTGRG